MPGKKPATALTKEEIAKYKKQLEAMRIELLKEYKKLSGAAKDDTGNDASEGHGSYSMHLADAASDSHDRSMSLDLASNEMEIVSEIEHALHKIEEGSYGICEGSGKAISKARLDAVPYVRFTREHQEEMEKRGEFPQY
jgi:RNA polymerase-binding transcription factor DksA